MENIESLPKFERGSQMTVFVDGKRIGDFGMIDNIRSQLKGASIKVVEAKKAKPSGSNVVLLAGRDTSDFRDDLLRLGAQGKSRDAFLALAKCGKNNDPAFVSRLIKISGARAVLFYDREINSQAVEDVLLNFSQLLMSQGVPNSDFRRLWQRSIDAVVKSQAADGEYKRQVLLLKGAIIQVSKNWTALADFAG
jgi:hypothetical protein